MSLNIENYWARRTARDVSRQKANDYQAAKLAEKNAILQRFATQQAKLNDVKNQLQSLEGNK